MQQHDEKYKFDHTDELTYIFAHSAGCLILLGEVHCEMFHRPPTCRRLESSSSEQYTCLLSNEVVQSGLTCFFVVLSLCVCVCVCIYKSPSGFCWLGFVNAGVAP